MSQNLKDFDGLTAEAIAKLAGAGVMTRDDLADLATDELCEIVDMTEEDAVALIIRAREHWFANEQNEAKA